MVLSIDYGLKRIGLALSDESNTFAFSFDTIINKDEGKLLEKICNIVKENLVTEIVIGLPLNSDDTDTKMSLSIREFAKKVFNSTQKKVILWNEIFTSEIAKKNIQGFKKGKKYIDSEAARVILQEYLDSKISSRKQ